MSNKQDPPEVAEFHKELYGLFDSRTASASKIDRLTKLAFKSAKYYKNIVYHLEKFITRCVPEYKLTGLYVLDSICRTSQSVKAKSSAASFSGSEYVARFEKNVVALFAEFCKVQEDKEKEKVKRVVDLWERSGTFSPTVIENIKKDHFHHLETAADRKTIESSSSAAPTTGETDDNATDKAASLISSLAASLAQGSNINTPSTSSYNPAPSSSISTMAVSSENSILSQAATMERPSVSGSNAGSLLLDGISDPSSALALQTLLATVSQVKAATAAAGGGGNLFHGYPSSLPAPMQQRGGSNDGSGDGLNGGPRPRDPRVDPRVDPREDPRQNGQDSTQRAQQAQQMLAQPHAQPLVQPHTQAPMFAASTNAHPSLLSSNTITVGSNLPNLLGPGFDGETMARLASFLNHPNDASKSTHLPTVPGSFATASMPFSVPLPVRGLQDTVGQGPTEGNQHATHFNLPGRPRMAQDPYPQRHNDVNDGYSQATDESQSSTTKEHPQVIEDPTVGSDQIRVISRTLWVGGSFVPTIPEQELEDIFSVKGKISTIMVNPAKFNAFIKMVDRAHAERCKVELDRILVHGEVMKVGWGCGFGPRDCFDYTTGASVIPLDRLTDTDRRWLSNSVVGGFGPRERIRGGVIILEPNIEPVGPDGREALPRKSRNTGVTAGAI
ncbi:hypothetical protein BGZ65_002158, partial [Modicella reniformis]